MLDALAIFDVDGTLVDSGGIVVETMRVAFEKNEVEPPDPEDVRALIGLSLPVLVGRLTEGRSGDLAGRIVSDYRLGFVALMESGGEPDLFPGVAEGLDRLEAAGLPLGIATGKAKRGLDRLIISKGWQDRFVTLQCADHHPSKPHPSMIRRALLEAATKEDDAVMIGDSAYDIEMALEAGVAGLGVSWGYNRAIALRRAGAEEVFDSFDVLVDALLQRFA